MKIITQNNELKKICDIFKQQEYMTIDTEFMRETTFWPKLCLIQIANEQHQYIIDPQINKIDLTDFFQLMNDKNIVKVFHAARQDMEILYNLSGKLPAPVFDTQIAAMVCGYGDQISYSNLVENILNININKKSRFTDWGRRPLSPEQLQYALADVTHLRGVYENLKNRIKQTKRETWLLEEMAILNDEATYDPPKELLWKKVKCKLKKPEDLAVLQSLACWREQQAKKQNVPRRRIMQDEALQEIAQQQPKTIDDMKTLRTPFKRFAKSANAPAILQAIKNGLEMPKDKMPKLAPPLNIPRGGAACLEVLKMLLKIIAEQEEVATRLIANTSELEQFIIDPQNKQHKIMQGWRYEIFGKKAQQIIKGEIFIGLKNNKIILKEKN